MEFNHTVASQEGGPKELRWSLEKCGTAVVLKANGYGVLSITEDGKIERHTSINPTGLTDSPGDMIHIDK